MYYIRPLMWKVLLIFLFIFGGVMIYKPNEIYYPITFFVLGVLMVLFAIFVGYPIIFSMFLKVNRKLVVTNILFDGKNYELCQKVKKSVSKSKLGKAEMKKLISDLQEIQRFCKNKSIKKIITCTHPQMIKAIGGYQVSKKVGNIEIHQIKKSKRTSKLGWYITSKRARGKITDRPTEFYKYEIIFKE